MTGEISAAGDVATGALYAHAVDPHGAGAGSGHGGGLCLNCGTRLTGAFCHACGQSADVHRTIGAIGHEIAHGVFHFEGRIWRTLPLLVRRPGTLTRRYIAGERMRFVSPLALFLFTVFLMFATISAVGGDMATLGGAVTSASATRTATLKRIDAEAARSQAERAALLAKGSASAKSAQIALTAIDKNIAALAEARHTVAAIPDASSSLLNFRTGWARLDAGIAKANADPGLMLYKLQSSAYKYSWALIPLSTPFVALLFLFRRRYGLYDHAIFVTYSIAFMMLLTIALLLAGAARLPATWITLAILVIPPIHMFAQLRGAYGLGKASALWRTIALLVFAFTVLSAFVILLLLHGLTE